MLDRVLSNIVLKVKKEQAMAPLSLHLDQEWIVRRVHEQISEEGYTIEPKIIDTPNGLGPFFNTLPQELRDMVFADCLASGYPQFMASSTAMRKEDLIHISEKGVFRMNFVSDMVKRPLECPQPTHKVMNNIQHLSVRIKGTATPCCDFWANTDLDILKQFGGPEIPRKSCKILFDLRRLGSHIVGHQLFAVLKTLVGFEVVEMRFTAPDPTWPHSLSEEQEKDIGNRINNSYAMCGGLLSPTLGFGSMGQDEGGRFMRFNPRGT